MPGGCPIARAPHPDTATPQGTVLCDIILLNFLKGAEHYKARKFEEVSMGLGPLWGWGQARVTSGGAGSSHTGGCGAG